MKKVLLLAVSALFAISCNRRDDDDDKNVTPAPTTPTAKVKYTNACISAGTLRAYVNDTPVGNAGNLTYLASSSYVNATPNSNAKISFVIQDSNLPLANTNGALNANAYYSAYAAGTVTNPSVVLVSDNITAPPAGNAHIRLINLSPDNLNESIYVGSSKVDSNIAFKSYSQFKAVPAGTNIQIIVQDPANVPASKTLSGQTLESGKSYTLMLTGTINGAGSSALTLTMQNNQ